MMGACRKCRSVGSASETNGDDGCASTVDSGSAAHVASSSPAAGDIISSGDVTPEVGRSGPCPSETTTSTSRGEGER